jgi:hypothetical protein
MKNYTYEWNVKDIITQFIAAFDDTIIKRYNQNREPTEIVEVRYVLAPKQRVMYDIVNKAQNLTLPVVALNVTSISRDEKRVFNKLDYLHNFSNEKNSTSVKMPLPINISISMSILTRYMEDMDQIISNFIPYTNPYIILAWKEPTNGTEVIEIRSEVLWDGNIAMSTPTDTTFSDKFRITADTTFTIKGWLFKDRNEISTPIYYIDTNYRIPESELYLSYNSLSGSNIVSTQSISAYPTITNVFYSTTGMQFSMLSSYSIVDMNINNFILNGDNYQYTSYVLLSSNNLTLVPSITSVATAKMGTVSGYILPSSYYNILNNNTILFNLPSLSGAGKLDVIVTNPAGYASVDKSLGFSLIVN